MTTSIDRAGLLNPDMRADELRLHMGEMTAQEVRTARAAIRWANSRAAAPQPAAGAGKGEHTELQHPAGEIIRARQGNARGAASEDRSAPVGTAPHPSVAAEAGKLPSEEALEAASQRIYEKPDFGLGVYGEKPAWVPRGNSLMQDMARSFARAALLSPAKPHDEAERGR